MLKRFLFLICLLAVLPAFAQAEFKASAKQAIIIDYDTGQILLSKNADQQMPTSSMSKVMTMVVVFDALKSGQIKLDTKFVVSEEAWRKGGSKMFVEVDKQVKIEDLIRGVIVQSGNDATIVLAEGLAGSETAFAEKMNAKAAEIGMTNSHFTNASGWPDDNHYSTAGDLAKLGVYLIKTYPEYYKYYGETEFTFNNIKQQNRNPLLYRNIGADGIKTGHTEIGGYGLIGSGKRNKRRVVIVLNGLDSERNRAQESAKILNWGLDHFENKTLFEAGHSIVKLPVIFGAEKEISASLDQDLMISIPKGRAKDIQLKIDHQSPLKAPITKGDIIAHLSVILDKEILFKHEITAANDMPAQGFLKRALVKMKLFILGSSHIL